MAQIPDLEFESRLYAFLARSLYQIGVVGLSTPEGSRTLKTLLLGQVCIPVPSRALGTPEEIRTLKIRYLRPARMPVPSRVQIRREGFEPCTEPGLNRMPLPIGLTAHIVNIQFA